MYKFTENSRVCFFGDSITHNGRYIRRVYDYYRNTLGIKLEMYNCGISGNRAGNALKHMEETVLSHNPTDVVISFGMNDIEYFDYEETVADEELVKKRRASIDRGYNNIKTIAEKLSSRGIRVSFTTPTAYDEISDIEATVNRGTYGALYELRSRVINLAKSYDDNVVDFTIPMFEAIKVQYKVGKSPIGPDRIHPTNEGQEIMAALFLKAQGFDVEVTYDDDKLKEILAKGHDEWEEKRFNLEVEAKKGEFVRYVLHADIKDIEEVKKVAKQELEKEEDEYVSGELKYMIDSWEKREALQKQLIEHTKSIYNG